MNNSLANTASHTRVTRHELIKRLSVLSDRNDIQKINRLDAIINRFMREEFTMDFYYLEIEIGKDDFEALFKDNEILASYILRHGDSVSKILSESKMLIEVFLSGQTIYSFGLLRRNTHNY